jgi:hypothetical protein
MYRQFDLCSGNRHMTCWLLYDKRLRPGASVTLKGDPVADRRWNIEHVSQTVVDRPPDMRWKVGGLV